MKDIEQLLGLITGETPEDEIIKKQLFYNVHKAIEKLKSKHCDIAQMFYWDGLSSIKIAEIVGSTPNSVRVTLNNTRKKLRTDLEKIMSENWIGEIFS